MDSESWLLVEPTGKIEEFSAPNEKTTELNPESAEDEMSSGLTDTNQLQLQALKLFDTIGSMLHENQPIRSVTEIGRDLLEDHYSSFQKQLSEIASNVSTRSLSAFERVKRDVQSAIAAASELDEHEGSPKSLHTVATTKASSADSKSAENQSQQNVEADVKQIWGLISSLRRAGKYPFMGHDLHTWFRGVCPVFEQELPNARPIEYLEGVKWYSEPCIAALIDECDVSSYTTWYEIENALHEYFETRESRIKKFEAAAIVSARLELLTS